MASHHATAQANASRNKTEQLNSSIAAQKQQQQQQNQYFHQQTMPIFEPHLSSDESSWPGTFGNSNCPSSQNTIGHVPNHHANSFDSTSFDSNHCQKPVADAAASFFAKATQKIAKDKKRAQKMAASSCSGATAPSLEQDHPFPTNFGLCLTNNPPSAPPGLFRNVDRRTSTAGKFKVALRMSPESKDGIASPNSFISVDDRRKEVVLNDPRDPCTKLTNAPPKMFAFDHVFAEDAAQAEICASTLPEVLQSVINGNDGCVFGFGNANLGKTFTMIGEDTSLQTVGIVPCAISWLFRLINEQKQKTGAKFSVRVSSVEIHGKDEHVKDLLADQDTGGSIFNCSNESPGIFLQPRDGSGSFHLHNHSELRAATADKAAFYLDAALNSRTSWNNCSSEEEYLPSHMIFTLHIYQYRVDRTKKNGVCGGRSRLHLIDLGNCNKPKQHSSKELHHEEPVSGSFLTYNALGNVLLALMNGSRHVPHRDSKLTQMLKEVIGGGTCCTVMISHVSCQPAHYEQSLGTIQLAHKLHRTKKRKSKSSLASTGLRHHSTSSTSASSGTPSNGNREVSSSSGGEYSENCSSCDESMNVRKRGMGNCFKPLGVLREQHQHQYMSSSDYSEQSSSEQSCDTVIYRGPDGKMLSDSELTDNERPPPVSRIISLNGSRPSDLTKIKQSNFFQPIREANELEMNKSRNHSDSEVVGSTRNSIQKLNKIIHQQQSPKCSTPQESDQEGTFFIRNQYRAQVSFVPPTRSNSFSENSKQQPLQPSNNMVLTENHTQNNSNASICSACDVPYENSSMFQTECNQKFNHNSRLLNGTRSPRYSNTSDSSFENIPRALLNLENCPSSPNRGVVSDTEVICNIPRSVKENKSRIKQNTNLSFITEESEVGNNNQSQVFNSKQARNARSAHNLANKSSPKVIGSSVSFKVSTNKSCSTASFFKEPPAEDDVWQIRRTGTPVTCPSVKHPRFSSAMSDGQRMQSTAMLVALGPHAGKMCIYCSTGKSCMKLQTDAASPDCRRSSCPNSRSRSGKDPLSEHLTSETAKPAVPAKKHFLFSKLRRSRTPEGTPKMKTKRFVRSPKSRCSHPSPSRKIKMKIPVLEHFNDRTPDSSPPPMCRKQPKVSQSSQSSGDNDNSEMDNITPPMSAAVSRYAFSDTEDMFTSHLSCKQATERLQALNQEAGQCQQSVCLNCDVISRTDQDSDSFKHFDDVQGVLQHQYETLDRVNQRAMITQHDKTILMQKFKDARISNCQTVPHTTYRLSSHTDSGLESMSSDLGQTSPRCNPDVVECHCPPTNSPNGQNESSMPRISLTSSSRPPIYQTQCSCPYSPSSLDQDVFHEEQPITGDWNHFRSNVSNSVSVGNSPQVNNTSQLTPQMNSLPCSPLTNSKGKVKRSRSADRKFGKSIFPLANIFTLRNRKKESSAAEKKQSVSSSSSRTDILSTCAPSERTISIVNPNSASKSTAAIARVQPVQRVQQQFASPASAVTLGTDSDSGVELGNSHPHRQLRRLHGTSLEAIPRRHPPNCNMAHVNKYGDCCGSLNQQLPEETTHHHGPRCGETASEKISKRDKETCSNPERCRNIKKKLRSGIPADIHQAALMGSSLKNCSRCTNLKEYWIDAPSTGSIPEDEVDSILENLGNVQTISDALVTELETPNTASLTRTSTTTTAPGVAAVNAAPAECITGHGTSPFCSATPVYAPTLPDRAHPQSSPRCPSTHHPQEQQHQKPALQQEPPLSSPHHQMQKQFQHHCAKSFNHKLPYSLSDSETGILSDVDLLQFDNPVKKSAACVQRSFQSNLGSAV